MQLSGSSKLPNLLFLLRAPLAMNDTFPCSLVKQETILLVSPYFLLFKTTASLVIINSDEKSRYSF